MRRRKSNMERKRYNAIDGLNTMIGNGWVQYVFTVVIVLAGTIIFSALMKMILDLFGKKIISKMHK